MSLFDSIATAFGGGGNVLLAGATIGSALYQSSQNRKAAETATRAREEADARIRRENAAAIRRYDQLAAEAAPGLQRLRDGTIGADGLTDAQRAELSDIRRQTLDAMTAGGLAGSGRATTAALRETENRYILDALDRNAYRGDAAATELARVGTGAISDAATVGRDTGLRSAGMLTDIGDINANTTTANAALRGAALGDIAGIIATDNKGRASRYQEREEEEVV